ncbi:MAG: hypothetical protein TR69_WS6001001059 [candidate division WS6 bacterium OLB20]|uniref:Uncharacterized protein n=1 Tax=candidate division WS6 bacterium OLB20 TaxID=1617426 RepID=A0A136LZG1_9BACT|nr:MAG: hypothetical protein TR69_WS6001001059 [candidate division WS6 bacterium OLB20]
MELKEIFDNHKELDFPGFPQTTDFSAWVEDFLLTDAHYVGIASRLIGGEDVSFDLTLFDDLKTGFDRLSIVDADEDYYRIYREQLKSLSLMLDVMISLRDAR